MLRRAPVPSEAGQRHWARSLAAAGAAAAAIVMSSLPAGAVALPTQAAAAAGGALFGWGDNSSGQIGDGTVTSRRLPRAVKIPAGTVITQVRAGCFHTLALTSMGQVLAWGANTDGQLGNGTTAPATAPSG